MTPIGFSQFYNNNYQFPTYQTGSPYTLQSSNGVTSNLNGLTGDMFQFQSQQNGFMNQTQNPMNMMMQMMQMMMGFMTQMMQMFMGMMGGMFGQQGQQFGNTGLFPSASYPQNNIGGLSNSGSYAFASPQGAYAGTCGGGNSFASAGSNGSGSYASSGACNSLSTAPASGITNNPGSGVYGGVKLNQEQINNARIIAEVGTQMGASKRDISIAIATAMQESQLKNINYGDRDSVGLFQQRPSCGWGSRSQCTDPRYSARKFYEKLLNDKNRNSKSLTQAAQNVQRSGFPNAYAKWENMAVSVTNSTVG